MDKYSIKELLCQQSDEITRLIYDRDYYKRLAEAAAEFIFGIVEPDSEEYRRLWEPHKSRYNKYLSILAERDKKEE